MSELDEINIRHLKLTSGDELLAIVNKYDRKLGVIVVERPLVLNSFSLGGRESHYLADWMPVSKNNVVSIGIHHIVAHCEVTNNAKEAYIKFCLGQLEDDKMEPDDDPYGDLDDDSEPKTFH